MVRHKAAFKFDKEYLNQISQDESACVNVQKFKKHLGLHPKSLTNTNESIKLLLNRSIGRFDKDSDGIILGYQNIALVSEIGVINSDNPFIHVDIEAEFFVFKAKLGQVLHGTVNRITEDHVGCLVHKTFNVSVLKPQIDEEWIGDQVDIGYEVLLRVTFTKFDERLPHIRAEFVSIVNSGTANNMITQNTIDYELSSKRNKIEIGDKYKRKGVNKHLKFDNEEDNGIDNTQETLMAGSNEFEDNSIKTSRKNKQKDLVNNTTPTNSFNENNFTEYSDEKNTKSKKSKKKNRHSDETVYSQYSNSQENEDLRLDLNVSDPTHSNSGKRNSSNTKPEIINEMKNQNLPNHFDEDGNKSKKSKKKNRYSDETSQENKDLSFEEKKKKLLEDTKMSLMPGLNENYTANKKSRKRNSSKTEPEIISEIKIKNLPNHFDEDSNKSKKSKMKNRYSDETSQENKDLSFEEKKKKLLEDTKMSLMPGLNENYTANKKSRKRNSSKTEPEIISEIKIKNLPNHFDEDSNKSKKSKMKNRYSDETSQENKDLSFEEKKKKLLEDTKMSLMPGLNENYTANKKSRKRNSSKTEPEIISEIKIKNLPNHFDEDSNKSKKSKMKNRYSDETSQENKDLSFEEKKKKLLEDTKMSLMPGLNENYTANKKSRKRNSSKTEPEIISEIKIKNSPVHSDEESTKSKKSKKKKKHSDEALQNISQHSTIEENLSFEETKRKLLEDTIRSLMSNHDETDSANKKYTKRKRNASETEHETVTEKKRKKSKSFSSSIEETPNSHEYSINEPSQDTSNTKKKKKKLKHEDSLEEQRNALMNDTMRSLMLNSSSNDVTVKKSKKNKKSNEIDEFGNTQKLNGSIPDVNLFNTTDSRIKSPEQLRRLSCNKKFDLPPDSDLESILNGINNDSNSEEFVKTTSRKRRKSCSLVL